MLKQRVITAICLLVALGLLLAFASVSVFAFCLSLIVAAAAWEWSRLCGVKDDNAQVIYAIVVGAVALFCLYSPFVSSAIVVSMLIGLIFWLCVPIQFYLTPVLQPIKEPSMIWLLVGILVLPIAAISIQYLRSYSNADSNGLLLYALAVVWVMDIGAYFSGRQFGKRKLAPLISPGKSWEGVYGGVACAAALFALSFIFVDWPDGTFYKLLVATLFAAAASVLGDLFESRIKRAAGMKDSSQLLPGHGGVLDRIDGVIAALPVFAFFWSWM